MKREKIEMSEIVKHDDNLPYEFYDDSLYKEVDSDNNGYDAEKGYENRILIFKRKSDNKHFKVEYTHQGTNGTTIEEETAYEVFPRKITKTIYE